MSIAFLFPGQGSQTVGMLHDLPHHSTVFQTLEEVSDVLGNDVLNLDSAESLHSTISVQLALLTCGVAVARVIEQEGIMAAAVAGHSVGAFSAAVHCGAIRLADSVLLVRQRAEMMLELYPKDFGLAVIVGLTEKHVSALISSSQDEIYPVYLANINAPRQIVIAGSVKGMQKVLEAARQRGATRAEHLPVSVPSHCPLLDPVAKALRVSISRVRLQTPRTPYMSNVKARALRDPNLIAEDLANNIAHGVRWYDATAVLGELGCCVFLEMPPGHVLTDLAKNAMSEMTSIAVSRVPPKQLHRLLRRNDDDLGQAIGCKRTL